MWSQADALAGCCPEEQGPKPGTVAGILAPGTDGKNIELNSFWFGMNLLEHTNMICIQFLPLDMDISILNLGQFRPKTFGILGSVLTIKYISATKAPKRLHIGGISSWQIPVTFEVAMMLQWCREHPPGSYHACWWRRPFPPHPATLQHRVVASVHPCSSVSEEVVGPGTLSHMMECPRSVRVAPILHQLAGCHEPPGCCPIQDGGHLWEGAGLHPP